MNGTAAGMAPKRLPRDIKSGHSDPETWACFSIRTFSNERPGTVSLFRKGIHCVLKCLRRSIDRFEASLCSLKRHGVCWTAGKRNPRWRGEGGGVKTILFSLCRSLKLYGCPTRGLKDRLVVWKPVLLVKVLKYSWTVLNHCFVVWMDAFSAQRRYPAVHGQVGGIVLLSRETCTVGKPIPLCPGDLKHCIVILKRSSVVQ
ncbi:hypothetical protein TNCT_26281 [Trichonephila clavata]|uniref:Uncharacterized protein n=2 Tax=Trichonephila clavata TaxID=2740835 RepID=A0A8X6L2K6_TRICU|nr:hypothetical protein TNCT_3931 [Trichonephila clavata]GFR19718.1 hypothetical protein TNCT_26241 [Trichonephila clavata]GFR19728.1 hypothetical protein TNCT_26281 [Trichonephila clavata]